VVALDGKVTAVPMLNQTYVQTRHPEIGLSYGLVRTMTAALVSAPGRPCIDAIAIPAETPRIGLTDHPWFALPNWIQLSDPRAKTRP
jgi:hypothetical protein